MRRKSNRVTKGKFEEHLVINPQYKATRKRGEPWVNKFKGSLANSGLGRGCPSEKIKEIQKPQKNSGRSTLLLTPHHSILAKYLLFQTPLCQAHPPPRPPSPMCSLHRPVQEILWPVLATEGYCALEGQLGRASSVKYTSDTQQSAPKLEKYLTGHTLKK